MNMLKINRKWNNFLNSLKRKEVFNCQVNIAGFAHCKNLTYNKYCKEHWKLRALECAKYHFLNKSEDISDNGNNHMEQGLLALVELQQRIKYRNKYNLKCDAGHQWWEDHLRAESWYFKIRFNYILPYDAESYIGDEDDDQDEYSETEWQDDNNEAEWINNSQFCSDYLELYVDLNLPNENNELIPEEIWG